MTNHVPEATKPASGDYAWLGAEAGSVADLMYMLNTEDWYDAINSRFVSELLDDTLPESILKAYLIQDFKFYNNGMMARLIKLAPRQETKDMLAAQSQWFADNEATYFEHFLEAYHVSQEEYDATEPTPANKEYGAYLDSLSDKSWPELITAICCMEWLYLAWAKRTVDADVIQQVPAHKGWVDLHEGAHFRKWVGDLISLVNEYCSIDGPEAEVFRTIVHLERRFFDLPGEDGPETYPYSTLISDLTDAICRLQVESYHQTLLLLLRRACAQYPPVDSLRQLLCGMIYATLQGNSSFVAVFSQMELTADDIICAIQQTHSAETLYRSMTRIIDLQISRIQGQITTSDETHVKRACEYIQAHFAEDFTLTDLAEHLELHPNYVSTIFRKVCGTSFSRYRKHLRMEEACRLIRETNDKFYLIGSKVGYPDAVSFARVFKEEMGCTPSEYRSMHASGEES